MATEQPAKLVEQLKLQGMVLSESFYFYYDAVGQLDYVEYRTLLVFSPMRNNRKLPR